MATELVMPRMGATMTEGTVVRWLKQPGAPVKKDEPVVEIETDKSTVELTAPADGVLGSWLAEVGTVVPIGQPLVIVSDAVPGARPEPAASSQAKEIRASPVAKRAAHDHGIDLALVQGSGPGGRIVEEDVLRAVAARGAAPPVTSTLTPPSTPPPTFEAPTGIRRTAAERMTHSFTTAPHFYLQVEADASALVEWYRGVTARADQSAGATLTYTDFLIRLSAMALGEHPRANASWQAGQVRLSPSVNIGVAVATDRGLIVPVLRGVERLALTDIARQRAEMVAKAKAGKILPDDYGEGTFTITNLGMFGIDAFQAILNPPQSAILAVGRIKERPFVVNGQLVARPTLHLSLSADHRVLDGADAARFLRRITELIELPQQLIA